MDPRHQGLPSDLSVRPAGAEDFDHLLTLYASTRAEELSLLPWDAATREAFLAQQFGAQQLAYEAYPESSSLVVIVGGEPAGRLYLSHLPGDLRIVDIALLPRYRGRGIGSRLLADVIAEAEKAGCSVSLHVENRNPAARLYERLGFVVVDVGPIYRRMIRAPNAGRSPKPTDGRLQ